MNEMAAVLEKAQSELAAAGDRQSKEPLAPYVARLVAKRTVETEEQWRSRMVEYASWLEQAAAATREGRQRPLLNDADASNTALWGGIVRSLQGLATAPGDIRAALKRTDAAMERESLTAAIIRSIQLVTQADSELRDAMP